MRGLMQDWPLTVDKILDHAKAWHGHREVVTRTVEGPIVRTTYAELHERAKRVSNALKNWNIKLGDRVATFPEKGGGYAEKCVAGAAGLIRLPDGVIRTAELHWYEASGLGRFEFKIKRYMD